MFSALFRNAPAPLRHPGLLRWLIASVHHWQSRRQLARMEPRLHRDAGLPPQDADRPDWDPPLWWHDLR